MIIIAYFTFLISWTYADRGSFYRHFKPMKNPSYPMFCSPLTPNMYNHQSILKDLVTLFEKLQNEDDFANDFHNFIASKISFQIENFQSNSVTLKAI